MPDAFQIVFSFDTTVSMYRCLEEVRSRLSEMVKILKRKIPGIQIAIFAHGDYCCAGKLYVTKCIDFTNDESKLCRFVENVEKTFGGDAPECYELVMREVQEKLSWRPDSQKALVLIGDDKPHEPEEKQNYRSIDWREETKRLRDMNIKIYAVECYRSRHEFYQQISSQSFGYYMPLSDMSGVKDLLMSICFREAGLEGTADSAPVPVTYHPEKKPHPVVDRTADVSDPYDVDDDDTFGMLCDTCKVGKLPNEFPTDPVSHDCEHHLGVCMRCVVKHVNNTGRCPQDGCSVKVDPNCQQIKIYEATLDTLFLDYAKVLADNRKKAFISMGDVITVSTINGDTAWIDYNSNMTITELKQHVEEKLSIKKSSQKILYNDTVLKTNKGPGQLSRLLDYGVQNNAELNLIVPLYCIPEDLDHVVFDLSWEFPKVNPDFLDASCLAFKGNDFVQLIDWNHSTNKYYLKGAVQHSAKNETRGDGRFGHQTIHVYLQRLPSHISHLYFTLSSWKSTNLSAFSNPCLQFYDASEPDMNLCSTTFTHALSHQAVVMCSVVRAGSQWQIYECDTAGCVNGNAKKYNPIRQRIVELIESEL